MGVEIELHGMKFKVPEGKDPLAYAERIDQQMKKDKDAGMFDAASDSTLENLAAGAGRGMVNIARNLGNMIPGTQYDLVSDEELAEAKELDSDLMNTTAGQIGNFVGETVATLPAGVGVGAAMKGLRGAETASSALNKTRAALTGTPATMGVEGAVVGSIVADPEERGAGALVGGGMSAGIGKVLKTGKDMFTNAWIPKSESAKTLEKTMSKVGQPHNIPLSQSGEGIGRDLYSNVVANMPLVGNKFKTQYDDSLQDFRVLLAEQAFPPKANYTPDPSKPMKETLEEMTELWNGVKDARGDLIKPGLFDEALEPIKDVPINVPKESASVLNVLNKELPQGMKPVKAGETMEVRELVSLKTTIQDIMDTLPAKEKPTKKVLLNLKNDVDDWIDGDLGKGTKFGEAWDEYNALKPYYKEFQDFKRGIQKEPIKGAILPKAMASNNLSKETGDLVALGDDALQDFPSKGGIFQNMAAFYTTAGVMGAGGVGAAIGGPVGALVAAGIPVATAKILASPRTQKMLAGELPIQADVAKILRDPTTTRAVREATRSMMTGALGDE